MHGSFRKARPTPTPTPARLLRPRCRYNPVHFFFPTHLRPPSPAPPPPCVDVLGVVVDVADVAAARMSGRALAAHPPVGAPLMQLLAASARFTGHTTDEGDFLVSLSNSCVASLPLRPATHRQRQSVYSSEHLSHTVALPPWGGSGPMSPILPFCPEWLRF